MNAKPLSVDVSEMAKDKVNSSKNNSENTHITVDVSKDFHNVHSMQNQPISFGPSSGMDGNTSEKLKRSSFQITRIVKTDEEVDNADDVDEVTTTEDNGSSTKTEVLKTANINLDAQSHDAVNNSSSVESLVSYHKHLCSNLTHPCTPRSSDINSRFKIVKIESNKPLKRGRWVCFEFLDPPQLGVTLEKMAKHGDSEITSSCITSPIYYVQVEKEDSSSNNPFAAAIIYSNGQPSLEPNPLPICEGSLMSSQSSLPVVLLDCYNVNRQQDSGTEVRHQHDSGIEMLRHMSSLSSESGNCNEETMSSNQLHSHHYATDHHQEQLNFLHGSDHGVVINGLICSDEESLGVKKGREHLVIRTGAESTFECSKFPEVVTSPLFAIVPSSTIPYASDFAVNDISGGICALDSKIEQAMDLVKSHLMFAVHEEVELLKEQIKELTIKKGQLEYENVVLRASATQETLEKLNGSSSSTSLS